MRHFVLARPSTTRPSSADYGAQFILSERSESKGASAQMTSYARSG